MSGICGWGFGRSKWKSNEARLIQSKMDELKTEGLKITQPALETLKAQHRLLKALKEKTPKAERKDLKDRIKATEAKIGELKNEEAQLNQLAKNGMVADLLQRAAWMVTRYEIPEGNRIGEIAEELSLVSGMQRAALTDRANATLSRVETIQKDAAGLEQEIYKLEALARDAQLLPIKGRAPLRDLGQLDKATELLGKMSARADKDERRLKAVRQDQEAAATMRAQYYAELDDYMQFLENGIRYMEGLPSGTVSPIAIQSWKNARYHAGHLKESLSKAVFLDGVKDMGSLVVDLRKEREFRAGALQLIQRQRNKNKPLPPPPPKPWKR